MISKCTVRMWKSLSMFWWYQNARYECENLCPCFDDIKMHGTNVKIFVHVLMISKCTVRMWKSLSMFWWYQNARYECENLCPCFDDIKNARYECENLCPCFDDIKMHGTNVKIFVHVLSTEIRNGQSVKYLAVSWLPLCNCSPYHLFQKGTEVSELYTGVLFP